MTHGSLFSGFGGFDYAAQMMGWNNAFHCEINPFCSNLLKYYWPDAESFSDIKKTDFKSFRGTIDIISGGFPCQPFSLAGKRKGTEDERHLWPQMLRAIREIQPRWIVGENVRGIISWDAGMVFEQVHADLEAEGYQVQAFVLPIAGINAPHKRERVWFVAYSDTHYNGCDATKNRQGMGKGNDSTKTWPNETKQFEGCTSKNAPLIATDTTNIGCDRCKGKGCTTEQRGILQTEQRRDSARCETKGCCRERIFTNTNSFGQSSQKHWQNESGFFTETSLFDYWRNFPIESPICSRNDGFSSRLDREAIFAGQKITKRKDTYVTWRNESIKGFGNAIGPHVALQIFQAIQQYENNSNFGV